MSASQPQSETAVRRTRVGVDAEGIAVLGDRIPRAVVGLEMHLGDRRDLGEHPACPSGRSPAGCCPTRTLEDVVDDAARPSASRRRPRGAAAGLVYRHSRSSHMCSGRFSMSGSVVYSSRTKPWNALPPSRSSRKPRMPDVGLDDARARSSSTRAVARSGPAGRERHAAAAAGVRASPTADTCRPSTCGYRSRNVSRQKPAVRLEIVPVEVQRLALDEVLHRIGGDRARCCRPSCRSARTRRRRRASGRWRRTRAGAVGAAPSRLRR